MSETQHLIFAILFITGFVLALWFLTVLWAREQVKRDLRRQACAPVSVRWRPWVWWALSNEIAFHVTFVDSTHCVQTLRCAVWFNSVRWIPDDLEYLDRKMPSFFRMLLLGLAALLIWFGLEHLFTRTLRLPANGGRWTWRGAPVILVSLAALCGAANLLAAVAFGYARGANQRRWTFWTRGLGFAGWTLFIAAGALAIWQVVSK